ncbi:CDP-glycerol glycerophosphotransferase family protein [Lentibacillus salinarum]|uniref:CDP-glycerol glycerophosphotransferase family protein n=1 Tax=Lentibacillus salinarum TaxID=446820 RepID=A0ABW3ZZM9_9BACI
MESKPQNKKLMKIKDNVSFKFIKKRILIGFGRLYKSKEQYSVAAIFYKKSFGTNNRVLTSSQYYEYGYVLYKANKFKQALEQIKNAIATSANEDDNRKFMDFCARIYYQYAQKLFKEKKFKEALEQIKNAIVTSTNEDDNRKFMDFRARIYYQYAQKLFKEKKFKQALEQIKNAIATSTNEDGNGEFTDFHAKIYYKYARKLFEEKKFIQALEQIDCVIGTTNKNNKAKYLTLRGEINMQLKQFVESEDNLRQSIELNGERAATHYILGVALVLQKKWYQAKESLLMAKELGFSTAKFYNRLGQANFELEHFADAAEAYQQAANMWNSKIESPITISEIYYMAGLSCERMGDIGASQEFYNKALACDEKFNSKLLGIGVFHQSYNQYDLAIKAYTGIEEAEPLFRLAMLYEKLGDKEKAISSYKRVLSLDQIKSKYHFRLAVCYETTGNYKEAVVYYKQAIARNSNYNHQWYLKLLKALHKSGDTKEYEQVLDEANLVADYVNDVYRNGNNKMPRRIRYNIFYEKLQVVEKTVLFESMAGTRVSGNPLAIFRYMLNDDRFEDYTFIWTVNNYDVVPDKYKSLTNVIFITRYTDMYYRYLATASILINDTTFPYFFILKDSQRYLNTWHGTPWKTLGYDVKVSKMDYVNGTRNFLQATHLLVPNLYTYEHQLKPHQVASIYPGELAITGYPRIDLTFKTMKEINLIKDKLGVDNSKKVILYAPTWRGGLSEKSFDVQKLMNDLERLSYLDANIIFRGHPVAEGLLQDINIPNIIGVPNKFDINEILGITDVLITDYSSVFFDFLVTGKPIVHYVYDYEKYTEERGLYFGLEELPGEVVQSSDQMIASVRNLLLTSFQPTNKYLEAKAKYVYKDDGNVSKRVIDWFLFDKITVDTIDKDTTKKKILFYAGSFQPNGITSAFISLVNGIDKKRYDITVTLSDSIINYPERLKQLDKIKDDVNIIPKNGPMTISDAGVFTRNLKNYRIANDEIIHNYKEEYQKEYIRLFGNIKFDYIVNFSGYSLFYSHLLANNPNQARKNVIYAHSDMYGEYTNKYPEIRRIFEQYKQYNKIISVSKSISEVNKQNLSKAFSIPKSKFDYIENVQNPTTVIEKSTLPLDDKADEELFSKDSTVFITIGRLSGEKDQEKLIRAFAGVQQTTQRSQLLILGNGPLKYKLLSVINELKLQKSVHLIGHKANPYPYLKRSDCFVFPSNYEGQGLVLYEALTLDKTIIATDIVTSRGVLEGGYGKICENSIEGLKKAMNDYLAGKITAKKFDIKAYSDRALEMFYNKVLNEN